MHQIFASGAFEEDPKNKVLPPKEKTGLAKLFEMKSTCWKAPDKKGKKVEPPLVVVEKKETEEERKKREDEEDQAEIKKAVEAKWAKILEKEDIRYKKRIDERRYVCLFFFLSFLTIRSLTPFFRPTERIYERRSL